MCPKFYYVDLPLYTLLLSVIQPVTIDTMITNNGPFLSGYHVDTPITIKAEASSKADSRPD